MSSTDKLTILFLAANPLDTDSLLLDEEVRAIDEALGKTAYRDRFDLRSHWALSTTGSMNISPCHQFASKTLFVIGMTNTIVASHWRGWLATTCLFLVCYRSIASSLISVTNVLN